MKAFKKTFDVTIIAHRGFNKKYPENTLLAFQKAIDVKADYIELDVHKTKDGKIVVIHDHSTSRVGDKDYIIEETDFDVLRTVDVGQGEKIPTLQEVFDLCKGKIGVQIEIKGGGQAEDICQLIKDNQMEDEVAISSFTHSELEEIKAIMPDIICCSLEPTKATAVKQVFKKTAFIKEAQRMQVEAIHPFHKFVNKKFCDKAHESNIIVNPWTVDKPALWEKMVDAGVDGIISNDPEGLYSFLESLK